MPRRVWEPLRIREMTADERAELTALSRSRKAEARVVERAARGRAIGWMVRCVKALAAMPAPPPPWGPPA